MVIDRSKGVIDPASGRQARLLRPADPRVTGLEWKREVFDAPFLLEFSNPRRAGFYFVRRGAAYFRTAAEPNKLQRVGAGTAVGIEGQLHWWMDASHVPPRELRRLVPHGAGEGELPLELLACSVGRSSALLQGLESGAIVVPPEAQPQAAMIRGCIDLIELELASAAPQPGTQRRLAEVVLLQLIAHARALLERRIIGGKLLRDECVLRAVAAFSAAPAASWTLASLAKTAGLSRSAFAERFTRAFHEPPLQHLNRFRLYLAAEMLKDSNAPVGGIAADVGFGSAAAFVRAFKREFGKTPGQWRESA